MKVPTKLITASKLIEQCATYLAHEHDQETAKQYAWWLLESLTNKSQASLIAQQKITLDKQQAEKLSEWLDDMVVHHKPLAYILGHTPFRDVTILVEPPTLIPRPETEEWVSSLIDLYQPLANEPLRILDLCTGTGCIALSFAQAFPKASVVGTDISDNALALAHKNAQLNNISNVTFIPSNLFAGLPPSTQFDLIVANPPYIAHEEEESLPLSVKNWENPQALFADNKGLALVEAIISQSPQWLSKNKFIAPHELPNLALEIGHTQGAETIEFFITHRFTNIKCLLDSARKDRVVMGSINHVVQEQTS